jgi:hypothetical protein
LTKEPFVISVARYAKAITAAVGVGLTVAVAEWGATNKWVAIAIAVASALGVYAVPNAAPKSAQNGP